MNQKEKIVNILGRFKAEPVRVDFKAMKVKIGKATFQAKKTYVDDKSCQRVATQILEAINNTDHQEIKDTLSYIKEDVAEIKSEIKK